MPASSKQIPSTTTVVVDYTLSGKRLPVQFTLDLDPKLDTNPPIGYDMDKESKIFLVIAMVKSGMGLPEIVQLVTIDCGQWVNVESAQGPVYYLRDLMEIYSLPPTGVRRLLLSKFEKCPTVNPKSIVFEQWKNISEAQTVAYYAAIEAFLGRQKVSVGCDLCSSLLYRAFMELSKNVVMMDGTKLPRVCRSG